VFTVNAFPSCSILPLDVLCARIEADVLSTLATDDATRLVLAHSMGPRWVPFL
jgi:hypothetical protein